MDTKRTGPVENDIVILAGNCDSLACLLPKCQYKSTNLNEIMSTEVIIETVIDESVYFDNDQEKEEQLELDIDQAPEEFIIILSEFTAQALTGIHCALLRQFNISHDSTDELHQNARIMSFAKYLNSCWRALILQNDSFVMDTFETLLGFMPGESPVYLLNKIYSVGMQLLQNRVEIDFSGVVQDGKDPEFVNSVRQMLRTLETQRSYELFQALFSSPQELEHECTGPSLAELANEDPESDFFTIQVSE
jgi:hypothetical protein